MGNTNYDCISWATTYLNRPALWADTTTNSNPYLTITQTWPSAPAIYNRILYENSKNRCHELWLNEKANKEPDISLDEALGL